MLADTASDYQDYQAEIAYMAGQLKSVHDDMPLVQIWDTLAQKYDGTLWTEKEDVQLEFVNIALASGVAAMLDESKKDAAYFDPLAVKKSISSEDSSFPAWYASNQGHYLAGPSIMLETMTRRCVCLKKLARRVTAFHSICVA